VIWRAPLRLDCRSTSSSRRGMLGMVIVVRFEPSLPSRAIPGADQFQERPFVGAMAYELESVEVEGVDVAAVLAWAETGHPMVRAGSA
jgi:hypothetical protein